MALPSQTERSSEGNRSVMMQPEGGISSGARTGLIVLGVALVGIAGYALARWNAKPTGNQSGSIGQNSVPSQTPAPVEITQGKGMPTTGTQITAQSGGTTQSGTPTTGSMPTGASTGSAGVTPFSSAQPVARHLTGDVPSAATGSVTSAAGTSTGAPSGANGTPPGTPSTGSGTVVNPGVISDAGLSAATTTDLGVLSLIEQGDRALKENKLVDARAAFSKALLHKDAAEADREALRGKLTTINQDLVFGAMVVPGDNLVESYKVQAGDALEKIRRKRELATDWRLIQRVNRLANPNSVRVGQTLKLVRGPFHAVVNKSAYRVDIFAGSPDDPANWLFIKSYKAGLGEGNSTPVGNYTIKKGSKLINPHWVNPRTGERFDKDDPKNPIGEFWIGWQGMGDSQVNQGYGFHGTIDPDSIGQQKSMGCVRLGATDIGELYELLAEEVSIVRVMP